MASTTNNGWSTPDDTGLVKDGASAMRTLGQAIDTSVGTSLLAWQSYTPTNTGWTGTWDAKYMQLGKTLIVSGIFTLTSATVSGSSFLFSLPAGKTARVTQSNIGSARVANAINTYGIVGLNTTTQGTVVVFNSAGTYVSPTNLSSGVPAAWSIGSTISFQICIEVV